MTAEKDPRIEAVAKLLFTGPLWGYNADDWDEEVHALSEQGGHRHQCLMAAEDVLRGIDEAGATEWGTSSGEEVQVWRDQEEALHWKERFQKHLLGEAKVVRRTVTPWESIT